MYEYTYCMKWRKKKILKWVASGHQIFTKKEKQIFFIYPDQKFFFAHLETKSQVFKYKEKQWHFVIYLPTFFGHIPFSVLTCSIIDGDLLDVCVWALGARLEGPDERVHGRPGDQGPHNPPTLL